MVPAASVIGDTPRIYTHKAAFHYSLYQGFTDLQQFCQELGKLFSMKRLPNRCLSRVNPCHKNTCADSLGGMDGQNNFQIRPFSEKDIAEPASWPQQCGIGLFFCSAYGMRHAGLRPPGCCRKGIFCASFCRENEIFRVAWGEVRLAL
jgi:hypothetical protein